MAAEDRVNIFGIRHHGPGSARSLLASLNKLQPDCILVEGPPEANDLLQHLANANLKPPVSLLIYASDDLKRAVYYPFAVFSPEWQALKFGVKAGIPVRFMDLPMTNWFGLDKQKDDELKNSESQAGLATDDTKSGGDIAASTDARIGLEDIEKSDITDESVNESDAIVEDNSADAGADETDASESDAPEADASNPQRNELKRLRKDPLGYFARLAGYEDSERWWENLVEHRRQDLDVFDAIAEAMTALRTELKEDELIGTDVDPLREAHMRQMIRAAIKEGCQRIAVVCGAWHVPALKKMPSAKEDQSLLKGLAKMKVQATWIPWTHSRLAFSSGYGAGIESPGWYHHLWTCTENVVEKWLITVARLLRAEDLDASSAHVIETVRLAETLGSMRGLPLPGLNEISEAIKSVLCFGSDVPMQIIHEKLEIGTMMGEVPSELPGTPLQKNVEAEQKRLRMPAQAAEKNYDLDLRNANDLSRSHMLHRFLILNIDWGNKVDVSGKSGSFHEFWAVRWLPEYAIKLIEASVWGKTLAEAAAAFAKNESDKVVELSQLIHILDKVLLADLPDAVDHVMDRVQTEAAVAVDVKHLMAAFPALVQVARYGNVRKTDLQSVSKILDGLVSRICVGLAPACSAIDADAAEEMYEHLMKVNASVGLLQNAEHNKLWMDTMQYIADTENISPLIAGRACRLLFDRRLMESGESARRFGLALSTAGDPTDGALWADGFLRGSGAVLIHDSDLLDVVDQWVRQLQEENFKEILPLLRRTFATYAPPERRQIGERIARTAGRVSSNKSGSSTSLLLNKERGEKILPILDKLLGLSPIEKVSDPNTDSQLSIMKDLL